MKLKCYSFGPFVAFTVVLLFSAAHVQAEESTPPAQSHEEHHQDRPTKAESSKDSGMMGSMKMDDMKGMMHECMEMHKNGKMCDHQMMDKCQEKMGKNECKKMMNQAKAKKSTEKRE